MIREAPLAAAGRSTRRTVGRTQMQSRMSAGWTTTSRPKARSLAGVRLAGAPRPSAALPMGHGKAAATCLLVWQYHKHFRGRRTSTAHQLHAVADDEVAAESQRRRRHVLTYLAVAAVERALGWVRGLQHINTLRW